MNELIEKLKDKKYLFHFKMGYDSILEDDADLPINTLNEEALSAFIEGINFAEKELA